VYFETQSGRSRANIDQRNLKHETPAERFNQCVASIG
jgi:hypothetical protein